MVGVGGAWIRPAAYTTFFTSARPGMPPDVKLTSGCSRGCRLAYCTMAWCRLLVCNSKSGRKFRL
eukprot:2582971-Amphidinium_carterae.1